MLSASDVICESFYPITETGQLEYWAAVYRCAYSCYPKRESIRHDLGVRSSLNDYFVSVCV